MRIDRIRLTHFGKFSNKEVELTGGLNIIEGSNEAGKSTIHAFIRGMLFGINKGRGKAAKGDVYTHFQPWDAPGAYQGSMDFEHEGREYRLSRVFLQQQKNVSLSELETGRSIETGDMGITALIPQLTPTAYDNTISCGQLKLKPADELGEYVRNYVANLASARDADVDVSGAVDKLERHIRSVRLELKNLDGEHLKAELASLYEDEKDEKYIIEDRDRAAAERERLDGELAGEEAELAAIPVSSDRLFSASNDYENMLAGIRETAQNLQKAEDLQNRLSENESRLMTAAEQTKKAGSELKLAAEKVELARTALIPEDEVERAKADKDESAANADQLKASLEGLKKKDRQQKLAAIALAAGGAICALLSADRFKPGVAVGVILMIIGLIMVIFALITSAELKKHKKGAENAETELKKRTDALDILIKKRVSAKEAFDDAEKERLKKELELKDHESNLRALEAENRSIKERADEIVKGSGERLKSAENRRNRLKAELAQAGIGQDSEPASVTGEDAGSLDWKALNDRFMTFEGETVREAETVRKLAQETAEKEKRHKTRIEELRQKMNTADNELARMEGALTQYGDIGERIDETEQKLNDAQTRRAELESEVLAAQLAKDEIERIASDLRSSFDRELNSSLGEECAAATAGRYTSARLDAKFGIEVMGDTDFVSVDDLSTGTQEQLYLALRMAVSGLFFGKMQVPMLFDESFAHYDDERMESVLTALSRQTSRQILIFTCNGQEREMLDRIGAKYNSVKL